MILYYNIAAVSILIVFKTKLWTEKEHLKYLEKVWIFHFTI